MLQFFTGTEMLVMLARRIVASLVALGVVALVRDRSDALARSAPAHPGCCAAIGLAVVVLAWPAWYALFGPGHYVGSVWPGISPAQASLRSFVVAVPGHGAVVVAALGALHAPDLPRPAARRDAARSASSCSAGSLRLWAAVALTARRRVARARPALRLRRVALPSRASRCCATS